MTYSVAAADVGDRDRAVPTTFVTSLCAAGAVVTRAVLCLWQRWRHRLSQLVCGVSCALHCVVAIAPLAGGGLVVREPTRTRLRSSVASACCCGLRSGGWRNALLHCCRHLVTIAEGILNTLGANVYSELGIGTQQGCVFVGGVPTAPSMHLVIAMRYCNPKSKSMQHAVHANATYMGANATYMGANGMCMDDARDTTKSRTFVHFEHRPVIVHTTKRHIKLAA